MSHAQPSGGPPGPSGPPVRRVTCERVHGSLAHRGARSSLIRPTVVAAATVVCVSASGCGGGGATRAAEPTLRVQSLSASVIKLGSWKRERLYGVRVRAVVCAGSHPVYPDVGVAHYVVTPARPMKWVLVRSVIDRPAWLVSLQESWRGKRCGPLEVEDAIPPHHVGGVEQLGNERSCYGVVFSLTAGHRHASRRAVVQCGGVGGRATCRVRDLAAPPVVVGVRKAQAVEKLRGAGFRVTTFPASKATPRVAAGVVIDQDPARGSRACRGTDVSIVVSIGKR